MDAWMRCGYINGQWVCADSGATFPVLDPATGEVLATVADMGEIETQRAIDAAHAAFPAWRGRTAVDRADCLRRLFASIEDHAESLAVLLSRENGKPLAEARGEVRYGASFVSWFAGEAQRIAGEMIPASQPDRRLLVSQEPVGVCALITPWNFPHAMITRKLAAALAAGCTAVVKPAEETPLSALMLAKLCHDVGIPPGVVNVVTTRSPAAVGAVLCRSPQVRKVSFTGSTEVGQLLMQQCAPTLKRLSLELGGSAPFLVFDDADLDAAVDGAMSSKYRNNGQTCVASNRFLVQENIAAAFCERVAARSAELRVGCGLEEGVQLGPMISAAGKDKVRRLLADAVAKGAHIHCGGIPTDSDSLFCAPTVLSGVTAEMALWTAEIFGPVIAVRTFSSEAEAISLANETEYGLAAYAFTQDLGRSWRIREALAFGMVGINTGMISTAQAPFGGVKQSGFGREGSRHGIGEYLQMKYTCVRI